jgi:P27 family predicted phage terminase small subunit
MTRNRAQKKPKAPRHLRPDTRRWWVQVAEDYVMQPHHLRLLTLAGEAWDRAVEAREAIAKDGAYYSNPKGEPKAHPGVAVERDSRIAFARLLRELNLDVDSPSEQYSRPPRLGGC